MLYYRFPLFFAIGTICVGLTYGNGFATALESQKLEPIAQAVDTVDTGNKAANPLEGLGYESLMQAGYAANQNKDYLKALAHFQKALTLRPDDSSAQQAVRNVTSYAFDTYMQAGYAADRNRDYQTALENFQKAQQIRPDSFYAQQAANNITNYLTASAEPNNSENEPTSQSKNNLSFSLMLMGLVASIGVAIGVLFLLLRKPDSEENTATKELKQTEEFPQSSSSRVENNSVELKPDTAIANSEIPPKKADASIEAINNKDTVNNNLPSKSATVSEGSNLNRLTPIEQQTEESFLVPPSASISKLDIVPELIQDLRQGDRATRHRSIWELAQKADSRAMKPLVELMVDANSQEQSLILEAMTQIVSRTLKPMNQAFMLSLENENSQVRQNAIRDLTTVYELMSQVTRRLARAVEDSDAEVQETAKWALKQLDQMAPVSWEIEKTEPNKSNPNDNA